jgi:hypothetical protein
MTVERFVPIAKAAVPFHFRILAQGGWADVDRAASRLKRNR